MRQIDVEGIGIWKIIETRSQPTLTRSYPRRFTLITRTARARASYLAALPSTRAIPDRDVFYVAHPTRSIQFHGKSPIQECVVYRQFIGKRASFHRRHFHL